MDPRTLLDPAGPLPRSVYWLRRVALVLVVVFVVGLIAFFARRGGGSSDKAAVVAPRTTPPVARTTPPVTTPAPTPTTATPTTTPADGSCPAGALTLALATSAKTYGPSGAPVHFTATLKDTGAACVAPGPLTIVVSSGGVRVWGSADCAPADASAKTTLTAGGSSDATRTWDRARSTEGCHAVHGTDDAAPGYYTAVASWAGRTSAAVSFRLE